jgi:hypothetical protein
MFVEVSSITPPAAAPGNGLFWVASLPGASCRLYRRPVAGDAVLRQSQLFHTDLTGTYAGWAYLAWGASWPVIPAGVTYTFYATCTAAAPDSRPATSPDVTALWPPKATPPPATPTPSAPAS